MSGREPLHTLGFRPSPFYSLNRNRQTFTFWTSDRGTLPRWPSRFQWSDGDALSSVASLSTPLSPWRSRIPSFRTCRLIAAEPGACQATQGHCAGGADQAGEDSYLYASQGQDVPGRPKESHYQAAQAVGNQKLELYG